MSDIPVLNDAEHQDCPTLHPEEHAWVESKLGRKLSTAEAQDALRDASMLAAFSIWSEGRR